MIKLMEQNKYRFKSEVYSYDKKIKKEKSEVNSFFYYNIEIYMVQLMGTLFLWVMFVRIRKSCIRIIGRNCIMIWIFMVCKY